MFQLICRSLAIAIAALLVMPQLASAQMKLDLEVEAVLRERLTLLREAVKLTRDQFQIGVVTFSVVLDAETKLGNAELELASTTAERIRVRENLLKTAEELEKVITAYVEGGRMSQTELLTAKAAKLRAKADLLLEKKATRR
jgi:outer membrane protein TolC